MAKAPRKLPTAKPIGTPAAPLNVTPAPAPAADHNAPVPGVIDPEADPTTNQVESPVPSSEMPTGPLPPSATTVDARRSDEDPAKGDPKTAQEAIERVKKGDYATDDDRQAAMKRWPNLFAETAKK